MWPASEAKHPKQQSYHLPPSPPSSGTVTAISSPRLATLTTQEPEIVDKRLTFTPPSHHTNFPTSISWKQQPNGNAASSDGDNSEKTSPRQIPRKRFSRRTAGIALTLPPPSVLAEHSLGISPPKSARPLSREFPSPTSSSSSSPIEHLPSQPSTSGIGRKVAATLQLFKEITGPSEEPKSSESVRPENSAGSRRAGSSSKADDVAEAQFEFVKRSEWPDRGSAAVRREKSSTALGRERTRESPHDGDAYRGKEMKPSVRDSVMSDLTQWRKDVMVGQDSSRGRRRERATDELVFDMDVSSDINTTFQLPPPALSRPRSRVYPPSPSPSRPPTNRISLPDLSQTFTTSQQRSRSPTPNQTAPSFPAPPSSLETFSPWSTDDEEAWETASVTTSNSMTSTTSANSSPFSPTQHPTHALSISHSLDDDDDDDDPPHPLAVPPHNGKGPAIGQKENEGFLDVDVDLSQEHLPHIPLRPFRNQVGGHSAIYKFTRRAVCKPLVSRENLFYESVEREAPPLLGFIPRYLGVMLVSYRRVPKGTTGSSSPSPPAFNVSAPELPQSIRPPFCKAITDTPQTSSGISVPRATVQDVVPEEDEGGDTETDEAEMPEVVLDRNRHIIPEWMLRSRRNRSFSHSYTPRPLLVADRQLKRAHLNGVTASTPDLGPTANGIPRVKPGALARYPPFVSSEMEAPTPANSPNQSLRAFPSKLAEIPSPPRFSINSASEEDDLFAQPSFQKFNTEQTIRTLQPPRWFGGTGSTTVNTKLKDHVFNTVLRRFRRRTGGRWAASARTEDEGDVADGEGDDERGEGRNRVRRSRKLVCQGDRPREADSDVYEAAVRRVQSESMIASPGKLEALALEQQRSGGMMHVFEMDYDNLPNDSLKRGSGTWCGIRLTPSISRRRSRSRSLDSHRLPIPMQNPHPSAGHPSIPEQNESDPPVTRQNHFILMEDLTGRLKHPCVMDLKMGTRQYGMDATPVKKKSQRKKCDRTTSRSLGVRVCGMQVWNHVLQTYVTQDKYMGREVRPEVFTSVLASFLYDGERLLAYQIPVLLQKLYALARIINRLKGYRFYGCSLLLIYDGDRESQEAFRSSVLEHPSSRSKRGESLKRQTSRSKSENKFDKPTLRRSHSEDLLLGPVAKRSSAGRKRGEVNVRIVDFAHTTTGRDWLPYPGSTDRNISHEMTANSKGYQPEVDPETGLIYARFPPHYPDQPDRGFLFGLKNLATTLERIWNEERIRRIKAARDDPSINSFQLPPLPTDGKEIFEEIFGRPGMDEDLGMIST